MRNVSLFLLLLFSMSLSAQYSITGQVKNDRGESLIGASVFLQSSKYATITDELGMFTLENVEAGDYVLKMTYLTYEPVLYQIQLDQNLALGEIKMHGGIYGLDEVEINATWVQEDQPFAYTNIDKKTIEKNNLGQDVPFALKWTPSTVVTSDAGAGVGYTGIRIRGSDPTRINVTINGIPLNDSESQGVFWVDLPDFLSSVDEIQIQRGVGTSTNGAGAFGASINLNTSRTTANSFGRFSFGYGSFDTRKLSAGFGTGLMNGKWSIEGKLASITSDGYIDRSESDLRSAFISVARLGQNSSLRLNIFSGSEVTQQAWNGLPFQFLSTNRLFNPSGTERAEAPYENEVDDYDQTHVQLFYDKQLNDDFTLNLGLHYTRGEGFFEQYKADETLSEYLLEGDNTDLVRRRWLDNHFYGFVATAKKQFQNSSLTFGGAAHDYLGRHFSEVIWTATGIDIPEDHTYVDNDARKSEANVFAKYDHKLTDKLNGFIDLQVRGINYTFEGFDQGGSSIEQTDDLFFFNPKAGLNYNINDASKAFISFAVANKEPNRNDYTESSIDSRPLHETLYDLELGYQYQGKKLGLDINLYNMSYQNQLVLNGQINDVGAFTRVNVPDSYRRGIELGLNYNITNSLSILPTLTLSDNKIRNHTVFVDSWDTGGQLEQNLGDTNLAFSPSVIAGNQLVLDFDQLSQNDFLKHTELTLLTKYVGQQFIDNTSLETSALDAYTYTDFRFNWSKQTKLLGKIDINAHINNVFNALYVSNAWIYRFQSLGYNPLDSDPFSRQEAGEGNYNLTGLFPQAGINFLLGITFTI